MTDVTVNADDLELALDSADTPARDAARLRLRRALPVEEPEPTHDPGVVEALRRSLAAILHHLPGFDHDGETLDVLDALADEGYEVVRPEDAEYFTNADVDALKTRIAELEADLEVAKGLIRRITEDFNYDLHEEPHWLLLSTHFDGWTPDEARFIESVLAEDGEGK